MSRWISLSDGEVQMLIAAGQHRTCIFRPVVFLPDGTVPRCPYPAGARLRVREACAIEHSVESIREPMPHSDNRPSQRFIHYDWSWWNQPHYRATDPAPELCIPDPDDLFDGCGVRWIAPSRMPKWASRFSLRVVSVRLNMREAAGYPAWDIAVERLEVRFTTRTNMHVYKVTDGGATYWVYAEAPEDAITLVEEQPDRERDTPVAPSC